ncbi:MAG: RHS repeat-associated core domain-containing protein, partial [Sandaracinaceae bacterium]|nr:RHS repeat-associated core domain-containing protein [Sandaracinaceae bacterium]
MNTSVDRGGWLELDYGENGNVTAMTVHGQCHDLDSMTACWDNASLTLSGRENQLRAQCACAVEQHYQYRWDEANRIVEARRFDRIGGSTGDWSLVVRQRYRYDSGNQRTIKQTLDTRVGASDPERIALYVYPGDFERRGLVRSVLGDEYQPSLGLDTETQYLVGGARVVWKHTGTIEGLDREQRITVPLTDLIQTTSAVLDLNSGALLEYSTYYPNGARESYRHAEEESIAAEPSGFTGKESDEEVGLVYFGERYLISRIGRWASPDPLQVHAVGGGEAINGYHYVGGNLLQARDPLGLAIRPEERARQQGRNHAMLVLSVGALATAIYPPLGAALTGVTLADTPPPADAADRPERTPDERAYDQGFQSVMDVAAMAGLGMFLHGVLRGPTTVTAPRPTQTSQPRPAAPTPEPPPRVVTREAAASGPPRASAPAPAALPEPVALPEQTPSPSAPSAPTSP